MANPFSNPAIYVDSFDKVKSSVDYTPNTSITAEQERDERLSQLKSTKNLPPRAIKAAEETINRDYEKRVAEEKSSANIQDAKDSSKATGSSGATTQQPQTTDWSKKLESIKETLIGTLGIDAKKYEEAMAAAKKRAEDLYTTIFNETNSLAGQNSDSLVLNFTERELSTVMGLPYQWMDIADNRLSGSGYGRKFHEKILSKMPLMVITPGIPDFMAGYSDNKKDGILSALMTGNSSIANVVNSDTKAEMRYYTLQFEAEQYYRYVNSMCTALAVFLKIENRQYNGETIRNINWMDRSHNQIANSYSYYGGIGLYLNSETQISENFNNESTRSIIADTLNSMSDIGREIQFLTGISGLDFDILSSQSLNKNGDTAQDWIKNAKPGTMSGFMGMIMNGTKTIFAGGKLEFPELWADSSYSSSYSINLKLISPDYDSVSWYVNIGVPLMHLIALCAPRQVNANGYISPFLVRAFYKGFFNIDMGLMSMSVQKGSEGGWTVDGLPTTVDITLEIKDLYSKLTISGEEILGKGEGTAFGNVGLITYLANIAGVNTNEPDIMRTARLFLALKEQSVTSFPSRVVTRVNNYIANLLTNRVLRKG